MLPWSWLITIWTPPIILQLPRAYRIHYPLALALHSDPGCSKGILTTLQDDGNHLDSGSLCDKGENCVHRLYLDHLCRVLQVRLSDFRPREIMLERTAWRHRCRRHRLMYSECNLAPYVQTNLLNSYSSNKLFAQFIFVQKGLCSIRKFSNWFYIHKYIQLRLVSVILHLISPWLTFGLSAHDLTFRY